MTILHDEPACGFALRTPRNARAYNHTLSYAPTWYTRTLALNETMLQRRSGNHRLWCRISKRERGREREAERKGEKKERERERAVKVLLTVWHGRKAAATHIYICIYAYDITIESSKRLENGSAESTPGWNRVRTQRIYRNTFRRHGGKIMESVSRRIVKYHRETNVSGFCY